MSFLSKKTKNECVLVFDIGSGSIGGAIVLISPGAIPNILYSFRSEMPFQEKATGARLFSLMSRSLSQVVMALSREGFEAAGFGAQRPRIEKILVSLSAPWMVALGTFLQLRNKEPMVVTETVFATLLEHFDKSENGLVENIPKECKSMEGHLQWSVLNGYRTAAPFGKEAAEVEFAVFRSFSAPRITERVTGIIADFFHAECVRLHAFSYVSFRAVQKIYPREENFILADVSGEQTEVVIARNGAIADVATFPFGRNYVARLLVKEGGIPAGSIETFFRLSSEGTSASKMTERVRKLLGRVREDWRNSFEKALASASEEPFFPRSVFITADADIVPIVSSALSDEMAIRLNLAPWKFRVIPIGAKELAPLAQWSAPKKDDAFIAIVSSFARESRG